MVDDSIILARARRETAQRLMMRALYAARPSQVDEIALRRLFNGFHFNYGLGDVQRELDYLRAPGPVNAKEETPGWWARLTALGVALVKHNTSVPAGIKPSSTRGAR